MNTITRHTYFLLLLLAALLGSAATSCRSQADEPPVTQSTPRTVLVYMVSHNNLNSYSLDDIAEMQQAALAGDLGTSRLIVYRHPYGSDPALYEICSDGTMSLIKTYDTSRPSISSLRLGEVIADTKACAPADKYGIIFWGHGTGYVQNGITPLSYGGETIDGQTYWMNVTDMADALGVHNFDWIYFDCCFMAGVEVAYELRHAADYIIASATELPAEGMPYQLTLRHLMPAVSDLPQAVHSTFDFFNEYTGSRRTCTMSLIRTEALDDVATAMRDIVTSTNGLPEDFQPQAFQTPDDHQRFGWSYYDLLDYASALTADCSALTEAIERAVPVKLATPKLWNITPLTNHCGLSTLIIESADEPNLDRYNYRQLAWWNDVVGLRFNN